MPRKKEGRAARLIAMMEKEGKSTEMLLSLTSRKIGRPAVSNATSPSEEESNQAVPPNESVRASNSTTGGPTALSHRVQLNPPTAEERKA